MAEHDLVKAIGAVTSKSEVSGPSVTGAGLTGARCLGASHSAGASTKADGVLFSDEALEDLDEVQGVSGLPQFGVDQPVAAGHKIEPGMQVGGVLTTHGGFTSPVPPGMQIGGVYTSLQY